MGVAYFIVLDRKIEGLDANMNGKLLAQAAQALDTVAERAGVRPLSQFISVDPEQAADFLEGEGGEASAFEIPPLRQFPAQEGLTTVRALLDYFQSHPAEPVGINELSPVLQDLKECERILSAAAQHNVKWHLEVDF